MYAVIYLDSTGGYQSGMTFQDSTVSVTAYQTAGIYIKDENTLYASVFSTTDSTISYLA